MYEVGERVLVGKGRVSRTGGIDFGGCHAWTDPSDRRSRVRIGVMPKAADTAGGDGSREVTLAVGDRFEVAGQAWELTRITRSGSTRWGAALTRIA